MVLDAKPNAAHLKLAELENAGKIKQSSHRILTGCIRPREVRLCMNCMEVFIGITVKNADGSMMQGL